MAKKVYRRRDAAGQHADFGIARRFVRMAMCLMKTSQVYLPLNMRKSELEPQERGNYYLSMWPYLKNKWAQKDALKAAFSKERPLGQWRYAVQEIYGVKLKL